MKQDKTKKTPKTEVVAYRMTAKMKSLAELAARRQRRSLTNFLDCAIEAALSHIVLGTCHGKENVTVAEMAETLWSTEPSQRFINLALNFPDLLNYDEQCIWDFLKLFGEHTNQVKIHQHWKFLVSYGLGELSEKELTDIYFSE